ncbi:MAG TPA: biotin/lipoyl-binding protein [Saprospiraceae bacterium]|nr:biotin/lipoyl-binding protein [Saprospiraceae bacterium]
MNVVPRFNFLYWLILPALVFACWKIYLSASQPQTTFFGYAENKETQLSVDVPVKVKNIFVSPGQKVSKDQVLIELDLEATDLEIIQTRHQIAQLHKEARVKKSELLASVEKARTEKAAKMAALERELAEVQSKLDYQKSLSSYKPGKDWNNPLEKNIVDIKAEIQSGKAAYDQLISSLQKSLSLSSPEEEEALGLEEKIKFLHYDRNKGSIKAPFDGLVGNVNCRTAEYIDGHVTLLSFYEIRPTQALAYVHESMSLSVNIGDSVEVVSAMHPNHTAKGIITGLGHRIVEIPERLRKIPEYKTYGLEVYIGLDAQNIFLQKEALKFTLIK